MKKLSEVASCLNIAEPLQYQQVEVADISSDSRSVAPRDVFVAIRGERFDGHDFIRDVERAGAAAVICEAATPGVNIPQLVVPNTIEALAKMATAHRQRLACNVIALTGSNGKTSVKEMIAQILPAPSFATKGNLNNHIGAPLNVLKLTPEHRFAVFELGASHRGEIAHLVSIVQPQVSLINNIAPAHIAGFGSMDGVADAKGEIYQGLMPNGTAIINDDDAYAHYWDELLVNHPTIRFSVNKPATIHAQSIELNQDGQASFNLVTPLGERLIQLNNPGRHQVSNALAAAACTYALGISLNDIAAGLQRFAGVAGRLTFRAGKHQSVIIDDTYNANLRSVLTAVDVLANRVGTRILVLGDMGELGDWTKQHHQEIGVAARQRGIDLVMTCGQHSVYTSQAFGEQGKHYDDQLHLTHDLMKYLKAGTTVLVKGSRSATMEKVVQELII